MFQVDNKAIGTYISGIIESKFSSSRDFCRRWLTLTNEDINEDSIRNKANKLSQIKKGFKGIQIYDLPVFSDLLGLSFEQILSAGKSGTPKTERPTNYYIAQSQNEKEWQEYIDREDSPIQCKDEFGLNILEYAIQFQNYKFIKFLMDKGYIWFDSRKDCDYVMTFGAGTSIRKINLKDRGNGIFTLNPEFDDLQNMLATEDQLRLHIIALACDNNDLDMLEKLRAREIPELYYKAHFLSCSHPDFNSNYDAKTVEHIAKSSNRILEYFTDSFEIRDNIKYKDGSKRKHTFVFPFISQLLDFLISNGHPFANKALRKMIDYNFSVYEKLNNLIENSLEDGCYYGDIWKNELDFYDNGNIVSFRNPLAVTGIITNIATVTRNSSNAETKELIDKLRETYSEIKNLGR